MKWIFSFLFLSLVAQYSSAQSISKKEFALMQSKEDSMKSFAIKIIQGINPSDRLQADSIFTKIFVRTLKIKNSFYYPFDSLFTISSLYAPDSSFRIFTWQLVISDYVTRQHGAIQMKTTDGSLKLLPLIDKSDVIENYEDTIGNNLGWIGAVYYKLLLNQYNGQKFYTLIGYDENNLRSNKKIIEILHFENDEPIFGGRFFSIPNNSFKAKNPARFVMEYKKEAGPSLNYDDELKMIVMEHLISESNEPNKKWTLVGDGDYEGLRWIGGKWVYISKIFNEVTPEGLPPTPQPIRDDKGNIDDLKLKGRDN